MKITKIVSKTVVAGKEQEVVLYKMKGVRVREFVLVKKPSTYPKSLQSSI